MEEATIQFPTPQLESVTSPSLSMLRMGTVRIEEFVDGNARLPHEYVLHMIPLCDALYTTTTHAPRQKVLTPISVRLRLCVRCIPAKGNDGDKVLTREPASTQERWRSVTGFSPRITALYQMPEPHGNLNPQQQLFDCTIRLHSTGNGGQLVTKSHRSVVSMSRYPLLAPCGANPNVGIET